MNRYKNLEIWKRSIQLAVEVYRITEKFPADEKFSLVSQLRRSSVSISSNIAEGAGRGSKKDFSRFLDIAYGSLCEVETQVIISHKLNYIEDHEAENICDETTQIQKMVYSFSKKLKTQDSELTTHD